MKWKENKRIRWQMEPHRVRICPMSGKMTFDKRGAQTAANKRFEEDHVKLRIYPCGCGGWHLTSRL